MMVSMAVAPDYRLSIISKAAVAVFKIIYFCNVMFSLPSCTDVPIFHAN